MNTILTLIFSLLMIWGEKSKVQTDEIYEAHIKTEVSGRSLRINNVFINNSQQEVYFSYKFKCKRIGRSGSAVSSQSGTIEAAPGEEVALSSTAISFSKDDKYELSLVVLDGNRQVAEDVISYPN